MFCFVPGAPLDVEMFKLAITPCNACVKVGTARFSSRSPPIEATEPVRLAFFWVS